MMNSCDKPGLMPVAEALEKILAQVKPRAIASTESVPLAQALGRVLAVEQKSAVDVPPADNSAMDGYAVNSRDLVAGEPAVLPVSQRIPAGHAPTPLTAGTTARIFTGAVIPDGADTVVMQEDCAVQNGPDVEQRVTVPANVKAGGNIRARGQDIAAGNVVVAAGQRLRPQDIGAMASVGIARVEVAKPLKVAILATGDELVEPGSALGKGQIYNSNRPLLQALIGSLGMQVVDFGRVADSLAATSAALDQASAAADVVLTTGGVSVGEEDYVKAAVTKLGSLSLCKLAIKPGKPLAFGTVKNTPFFGLPGNPAAVFVTFCILVRRYLLAMEGVSDHKPLTLRIPVNFSRKPSSRQEYLRARLVVDDSGQTVVDAYHNQSSGVLYSAVWGNGFAVVPPGHRVVAGDCLEFIPYCALFS